MLEIEPAALSRTVLVQSASSGRLRLRVAGLYRSHDLKHFIEQRIAEHFGDVRANANVLTGSLLVETPLSVVEHEIVQIVEQLLRAFALENGTNYESFVEPKRAPTLRVPHVKWPPRVIAEHPREPTVGAAQAPVTAAGQPWHTLDADAVTQTLGADLEAGLSEKEAADRLARYGKNRLPEAAQRSTLSIFIEQLKEWPVALLAGSAVVSVATGGVADAIAIVGVVIVNAVIGTTTERTAERTIASLTRQVVPQATVLREGVERQIGGEALVPGDVMELKPGVVVPADARLVAAERLTVDESALTGESLPTPKTLAVLADAKLPLGDRTNMVYRSTTVMGGSGRALVVATGLGTEIGRIQAMVEEVERPETPVQKQLRVLGQRTMVLAGAVCGSVFAIGLLRGQPFLTMFKTAVSLAVAAVPEGLPTVAITTLALGVRRMQGEHVIVRRLDAVETLGSVQVLCFDKTGTITKNRMVVTHVLAADRELVRHGRELRDRDDAIFGKNCLELEWLLRVGVLCSEAEVEALADGLRVTGTGTESSLVELALDLGLDANALRAQYAITRTNHRAQDRNFMTTVHELKTRSNGSKPYVVAVKGRVDEVLERCTYRLVGGRLEELTPEQRSEILEHDQAMARGALRVLGFAYAELDEEPVDSRELTWLGMAGMVDPPRDGLRQLMDRFHAAGVHTVMITGDQSATACAIATQIGLGDGDRLEQLDSTELELLDPAVLAQLARRAHVFSRVSPAQKLQIVRALQAAGFVVAMTGDGVNDGPALKAADIGVAMGRGATEVAHEVADIVLADSELGAMLVALEHGRVIYDDIRKAVHFILATNLSEILFTFVSVALGFGGGLSPMQLLWINIVSDIFPELALAQDPPERDVLERQPRAPDEPMFSGPDLRRIALEGGILCAGAIGSYGYGISRYGAGRQASALGFVSLTTAQLLHAFSARSEHAALSFGARRAKNPYLPASVAGGIGLTFLIQSLSGARRQFGSARIRPGDWLITAAASVAPFFVNEAVKAARLRRRG